MINNLKEKTRISNIELLRIIAMLMIVAHHFVVHGIMHITNASEQFLYWSQGSIGNKIFSAFFYPGGEVGVAVFFIITGYFCINREKGSIRKVVIEALWYGVFSVILFLIALKAGIGFEDVSTYAIVKRLAYYIITPASGGGGIGM